MPSEFAIDYIQWVFFSALGAFQFVAAKNGLNGVMLVRGFPRLTMIAALALVGIATAVFFASEPRNQPDAGLGLDANEQGRWFVIAAMAAIGATVALTSMINHRWGAQHGLDGGARDAPPFGIEWLQRTTFARAFAARVGYARRPTGGAFRVGD